MRKLFQSFMAAAVLATGVVTFSAPQAEAQSLRERQRFVERFCARNPGARDCRDFRRDYRRWDDRRYNRWYRENYRDRTAATPPLPPSSASPPARPWAQQPMPIAVRSIAAHP
ncbi:hypothetical protein [Aureimonas sp. SK2]|uniref:hypothetical protein n=1 Tax=Aureimonas sp. SK2 TaxID=3015992 RepID=UPI00244462E9|nr:hypothetical protein [Aureimonas sp. SK2]